MDDAKKRNRRYLVWFLIGVLVALLPWIILA